jgi:hypothetical protein
MPAWKTSLVILAMFGLSWIGIVIGWVSWDQDRAWGRHLLKHSMVQAILLILAVGVAILAAGAILLLQGFSVLLLAIGAGIASGIGTYLLGKAQLRSER